MFFADFLKQTFDFVGDFVLNCHPPKIKCDI